MAKGLYVNGVGMTVLTPVTKMMASLPWRSWIIRLRMPWSFASAWVPLIAPCCPGGLTPLRLSWFPVFQTFWYFHADGPELMKSPRSHVVIDDGRRFLERTPGSTM